MSQSSPSKPHAAHNRQPDDYFEGSRRYLEKKTGLMVVNVHAGDCFITSNPKEVAATVLGSCISACIRDPVAGVGGMNHFLLPSSNTSTQSESARFGAYAMEKLINEILKRGGRRERLEAKLFGGGNVIESSALIGDKNAQFAKEYLQLEEIRLLGSDVGGSSPRKVRYYPITGKAMVRKLRRDDDYRNVRREEEGYNRQIATPRAGNDVDLF